ncbi:MAG TPA: hypothetical protein VHU18_11470 [Rhizomicrobium sp.]|jgi:hypothetical protein|nr:hypothetical protein [Rhizomicrobium sp.]
MGALIEITLGIMTAVGGFVDISELVVAAQAGSRFKQPVFNLMRQRLRSPNRNS